MSKLKKSRKPPRHLTNLATPFERFITRQVSAGMLLFGATIFALLWANSPWGATYSQLWHLEMGLEAGRLKLIQPLHLWINDGLMALFFFVIGLEIKREIVSGELSEPGKALLPVMAALGGMVVPVGMFLVLNPETGADHGWGIPMATDIAFSLGILQLLGKRIPLGLKVFLTAFAIVDDLGAVAVIAVFYSQGMDVAPLLGAAAILIFLGLLSWRGYYNKYFYFLGAVGVWLLFFKGGLHPTLAGVLVAFTIPIKRSINLAEFLRSMEDAVSTLRSLSPVGKGTPLVSQKQLDALDDIDVQVESVVSPLQHLEHKLHGYMGYLIMPLFALANAGVPLRLGDGTHNGLIIALATSMVLGKFLGIVSFSMLAVKLGWSSLPQGVTTRHLLGVGLLGGLGFTMALFIAGLAYPDLELLGASKLGILLGSTIAGVAGYLVLRGAKPAAPSTPPVPIKRPAPALPNG